MGFTKLDEGILQSSIMAERPSTFKVWIAILASCDFDGIARVSAVFLASACHLPQRIVDQAIEILSAPDQHSRTLEDDGRRIRRVDGGFFVINYDKYRAFTKGEGDPNSPGAIRIRRWREKHKSVTVSPVVTDGNVTGVTSASVLSSSSLGSSSPKITEIIEYLNTRTGKKFKATSEATTKLIRGRLAEGRTLEDFKHVIDVKAAKWLGDPKMDDFLRPDTLFRPGKFESYLNERLFQPKAPAHLRVGSGSEPKPVSPEQKAEQDRKIAAACDEIDRKYGQLIETARKAGDKIQVKRLADDARKAREGAIVDIIYPRGEART